MEPGYYDAVEYPEEDYWILYLVLGIPLLILTIRDIVTAIPIRIADFLKETFARY